MKPIASQGAKPAPRVPPEQLLIGNNPQGLTLLGSVARPVLILLFFEMNDFSKKKKRGKKERKVSVQQSPENRVEAKTM